MSPGRGGGRRARGGWLAAVATVALAAGGLANLRGAMAAQLLDPGAAPPRTFKPGEVWRDTGGRPVQAHGGCLLHDTAGSGAYFWFGENKDGPTYSPDPGRSPARCDVIGISVYRSTNLYDWEYLGLALPAAAKEDTGSDLHPSRVVERPKVIHNEATGQYVMWMHIDDPTYKDARVGVAVSAKPEGPYSYKGSFRPHGEESRDFTVFKDDDDKTAYYVGSSENNRVTHISPLTEDYLGVAGDAFNRVFIGESREAPAVFKSEGAYLIVSSGCSGWAPNAAEVHVAADMMGEWTSLGNPAQGTESERKTTFRSQSTFVLPLRGRPGEYIFLADRWNQHNLSDSRYVWLPMTVRDVAPEALATTAVGDGDKRLWKSVSIRWRDAWSLEDI